MDHTEEPVRGGGITNSSPSGLTLLPRGGVFMFARHAFHDEVFLPFLIIWSVLPLKSTCCGISGRDLEITVVRWFGTILVAGDLQ